MIVQYFRKRGVICCVKVGYIAADIPTEWKIRKAEYRGTSIRGMNLYYDVALNGKCVLHILKWYGSALPAPAFFFEEYPL